MSEGKTNTIIVVVIVLVAVAFFVIGIVSTSGGSSSTTASERKKIVENRQDNYKGNKDAKVVVVEFSDFQCPACAAFAPTLDQVITSYGNKVKFVYRHLPLSSLHPNAKTAALAAEAAAAQGKFWEMHDALFNRQSEWVGKNGTDLTSVLVVIAEDAGVPDIDKFKSDLENATYQSLIDKDTSDASKLGLQATPTIYVNGVKVTSPSKANVELLIDSYVK